MKEIYVILRETGEYSDRDVTAIRYALTEAEAQALVERAQTEARTLKGPPYPQTESHLGWQMPDGTFRDDVDFTTGPKLGGRLVRKPNAEELERAAERAKAAYWAECEAMGCVDPAGPIKDARYYFERVTPLGGTA